jgi:hypothetical protein
MAVGIKSALAIFPINNSSLVSDIVELYIYAAGRRLPFVFHNLIRATKVIPYRTNSQA